MSCGDISRQGSCGGGIKRLGCCFVPLYGPHASGLDIFDTDIGPDYSGLLLVGGDGGGWDGDPGFGGDGNTFGDDGDGDNWFDGDASFGGGGGDIGDDPPPGCFLYGTRVALASGELVAIETLEPGDEVQSLFIHDMPREGVPGEQFRWRSSDPDLRPQKARVESVRHAYHDGHYVINGRVRATFEHPFLVRRDGEYGFLSASLIRVGDELIARDLTAEPVTSVERVGVLVRTVELSVADTMMLAAEGVWAHNAPGNTGSGGGVPGDPIGKSGGGSF